MIFEGSLGPGKSDIWCSSKVDGQQATKVQKTAQGVQHSDRSFDTIGAQFNVSVQDILGGGSRTQICLVWLTAGSAPSPGPPRGGSQWWADVRCTWLPLCMCFSMQCVRMVLCCINRCSSSGHCSNQCGSGTCCSNRLGSSRRCINKCSNSKRCSNRC